MSTAEKLRREGLRQGLREGLREGEARGEARGRLQRGIELVLRLLTQRYGPLPAAVKARVRGASARKLDHWAERLLEAKTLADVFAD